MDRGELYDVRAVEVTNRGDGFGDRLSPFDVLVDAMMRATDVSIEEGQTLVAPPVQR